MKMKLLTVVENINRSKEQRAVQQKVVAIQRRVVEVVGAAFIFLARHKLHSYCLKSKDGFHFSL
jgi:hypothetical protein